jgi:hypothetical protein
LIGTRFVLLFSLLGHNANSGLAEAPIGSPDANGNLIGGDTHGFIDPLIELITLPGEPSWINTMYMFGLSPSSPAINAGDPAAAAGLNGIPVYDQRGAHYARVYGGRIDIGAFELQPDPLPGDYNYDNDVNVADYVVWRKFLGTTSDMADGDNSGVVDQIDGDIWTTNFGSLVSAAAMAERESVPSSATRQLEFAPRNAGNVSVNKLAIRRIRPTSSSLQKDGSDGRQVHARVDPTTPRLRDVAHREYVEKLDDDGADRELVRVTAIDAALEVLCSEVAEGSN